MLKRFVIERAIPSIGNFSVTEFCSAARSSNLAISEMDKAIQWQHSYVAENKLFCVYLAENEQAIVEHADVAGIPADKITEILQVIDPMTGND